MSLLQMMLPVLWTVVAVGVGLVLYKSSKARVQTKVVRVTGSAAVALLAFYGMYHATPTGLLERTSRSISEDRLAAVERDIGDAVTTLKGDASSLCVDAPDPAGCGKAIGRIETLLSRAQNDIKKVADK